MTLAERIGPAKERRTCFACTFYSAPHIDLSGLCARGGLDPKHSALAASVEALRSRITVRWDNACPSFKEYEA